MTKMPRNLRVPPRAPDLADLSPWDFIAALCRPVMVQLGPCPQDHVPSATEVPKVP